MFPSRNMIPHGNKRLFAVQSEDSPLYFRQSIQQEFLATPDKPGMRRIISSFIAVVYRDLIERQLELIQRPFVFLKLIVSNIDKIRREQLIRRAEGYLDLVLCLEDQWLLDQPLVDSISQKALAQLALIDSGSGRKSHIEYLKGQAFRLQKSYEQAVASFWNSLETDSENVHSLMGLAWCYKRLNEFDLATESLYRALEIQPENPVIYFNLACYHSLLGNIEPCCDYLQKALELEDKFRDLIDSERDFDPMRNHPQFQAIVSVTV